MFALDVRPDVIFFLTDGEFNDISAKEIGASQRARQNKVGHQLHPIGDPGSPELLKTISSQSGGLYRFVPVPEDERGIDQDLSVHLLGSWCHGMRTPTPSSVAAAESTQKGTISKFDDSGITIRDTFVPWDHVRSVYEGLRLILALDKYKEISANLWRARTRLEIA